MCAQSLTSKMNLVSLITRDGWIFWTAIASYKA